MLLSNVSLLRKPIAEGKKEEDDGGTPKFEDIHSLGNEKKTMWSARFWKAPVGYKQRCKAQHHANNYIPHTDFGATPKDYPQSHRLARA